MDLKKTSQLCHRHSNAGVTASQMNFPQKYCSVLVMHAANTKEEEATSGI